MGEKRWGLLFSAFFTAHLFAGPSPEFVKTSCIKYRAKIALRPATVTTIRRRLIRHCNLNLSLQLALRLPAVLAHEQPVLMKYPG